MMKTAIRVLAIAFCVLGLDMAREATAVVGRPATPISVAGVARRTTRRVIRRTSVYVATLPVGYTTVVIDGSTCYHHGGTYYQPYGGQYVVVTVD
jgi:hypothetical protein